MLHIPTSPGRDIQGVHTKCWTFLHHQDGAYRVFIQSAEHSYITRTGHKGCSYSLLNIPTSPGRDIQGVHTKFYTFLHHQDGTYKVFIHSAEHSLIIRTFKFSVALHIPTSVKIRDVHSKCCIFQHQYRTYRIFLNIQSVEHYLITKIILIVEHSYITKTYIHKHKVIIKIVVFHSP